MVYPFLVDVDLGMAYTPSCEARGVEPQFSPSGEPPAVRRRLQSAKLGDNFFTFFGFIAREGMRETDGDEFVPMLPHHKGFMVGVEDDANFPTGKPVIIGVTFKVKMVEAAFFTIGVGVVF